MYNALVDGLPDSFDGYPVNTDFETGIQIMKVLDDDELTEEEKYYQAATLLFDDLEMPPMDIAINALLWWMTGWNNDRKVEDDDKTVVMDMDVDQWRIYSAFRSQYHIDLMRDYLHFWEFMALLTTLGECAFTRVIDIRGEKESRGMSQEEKRALRKAKAKYSLKPAKADRRKVPLTQAEEDFLKYANIGKTNTAP